MLSPSTVKQVDNVNILITKALQFGCTTKLYGGATIQLSVWSLATKCLCTVVKPTTCKLLLRSNDLGGLVSSGLLCYFIAVYFFVI